MSRRRAEPKAKSEAPHAPKPASGDSQPTASAENTRERMVKGAAVLLAKRGLQATSFSEVLEATGAPRGSIYHHFPEGKDQLVGAALQLVTAQMNQILDSKEGAPALEITELFLSAWRTVLTRSQLKAGCAVVAVTVATDSPDLLAQTSAIFRSWRARLTELLVKGGLHPRDAGSFAALLIAASEGAVILSRGEGSLDPFEMVAKELVDQVKRLAR